MAKQNKQTILPRIQNLPSYVKILMLLFPVIPLVYLLKNLLRGEIEVPKSLTLGPIQIHFYGIFILLGAFVVYFVSAWFLKQRKIKVDYENLIYATAIPGIIGARLAFVLTHWGQFSEDLGAIFRIWEGGILIHGALIGAFIGLLFYYKFNLQKTFLVSDIIVLGIPLGQIIGRFGNLINQEAYGFPTDLPWGMFVREENRLIGYDNAAYFHPFFLYEDILNLTLFGLLIYAYSAGLSQKRGLLTVCYFIGYGLIRFALDWMRLDFGIAFGLNAGQIGGVFLIVFGIGLYALRWRTEK